MSEIESIIDALLNAEENILGVAIIGKSGNLITQTENWDIAGDLTILNELLNLKLELGERGITSISVQSIKYMIVENTEERKIGTNITGKGHLIIAPVPIGGTGALICYINPAAGPRDALYNIQEFAKNLTNLV
jgi:predicted regulator of Ras-like GTPase activity (Roadblock/LC7/MglB family)